MFNFYITWRVLFLLLFSFIHSMVLSQFTEQWVARYNGSENKQDVGKDIVVDDKGNIYVTGQSMQSGTNTDYITIKYDAAGNTLWTRTYDGAGSEDIAVSMAVDHSGNVYVTGGSVGNGTSNDFATIKYNENGTEQWVRRFNGPIDSYDAATALGLDGSGNI